MGKCCSSDAIGFLFAKARIALDSDHLRGEHILRGAASDSAACCGNIVVEARASAVAYSGSGMTLETALNAAECIATISILSVPIVAAFTVKLVAITANRCALIATSQQDAAPTFLCDAFFIATIARQDPSIITLLRAYTCAISTNCLQAKHPFPKHPARLQETRFVATISCEDVAIITSFCTSDMSISTLARCKNDQPTSIHSSLRD
jgi:hypothetical protein